MVDRLSLTLKFISVISWIIPGKTPIVLSTLLHSQLFLPLYVCIPYKDIQHVYDVMVTIQTLYIQVRVRPSM